MCDTLVVKLILSTVALQVRTRENWPFYVKNFSVLQCDICQFETINYAAIDTHSTSNIAESGTAVYWQFAIYWWWSQLQGVFC